MAIAQADRIAFSLQIVGAPAKITALTTAKGQINAAIVQAQALDSANKNLFDPLNLRINGYQTELGDLTGTGYSTIVEQDIQDSANKKLQNHFFPNDTTVTVPSLSGVHNVWTKVKPFALTYAIGKNYTEAFGSVTNETTLITSILALITSAGSFQDIENTSGQQATMGQAAHCSNSSFSTQSTCLANGGTWFPATTDTISTYPAVVTLKTNLVAAINSLVPLLTAEAAAIVTTDPNPTVQSQNTAAKNNILNVILPALNTWLGYADFNPVPGSVTTYSAFYAYNSNLLAPTKLHSAQLSALQTALNSRTSVNSVRITQIQTVLGGITQDLTTGEITVSSGAYGTRYNYLLLRLNSLGGSLTNLLSLQTAGGAQDSIISSLNTASSTYGAVLPTSLMKAPANGTTIVHLINASLFSPGDTVYIFAEGQQELQRAIKSINNDAVTLNDVVPAKYDPSSGGRMYKDLS